MTLSEEFQHLIHSLQRAYTDDLLISLETWKRMREQLSLYLEEIKRLEERRAKN